MTTFSGLTADVASEAVELALPSIENLSHGSPGHLVVLRPGVAPSADAELPVVYRRSWGEKKDWRGPYDAIAESKARISWTTGLPSHAVQQLHPYLYQQGWTKWGGSAVGEGGLVVAYSGDKWFHDQFYSELVVSAIKVVCLREIDAVLRDPGTLFLGNGGENS
ncbi:hypothetical protein ACFTZB_01545 [Rhodococcus sp. NPDC057014]|uniref:hypothetical protein n=1 Tax=Rhodococcus sp. NPDC057014 TaxID=3346000 RepID=UPI003629C43A